MFWTSRKGSQPRMFRCDWNGAKPLASGDCSQPHAPIRTAGALELLPEKEALTPGVYRLGFETATYFAARKVDGLYPLVEITFQVREGEEHFHIPLLLSPNGYTTYRGS